MDYIHRIHHHHTHDPENVTEAHRRDLIMRYYDFVAWCKDHSQGEYRVENTYQAQGITVFFENQQDYQAFIDFCKDYWLHLHD